MVDFITTYFGPVLAAIFGSIALIIYTEFSKRVKLHFSVESSDHTNQNNRILINIHLSIDNRGEKTTTIKTAYLESRGKEILPEDDNSKIRTDIAPGANRILELHFSIGDNLELSHIDKYVVDIEHTHGKSKVIIPVDKTTPNSQLKVETFNHKKKIRMIAFIIIGILVPFTIYEIMLENSQPAQYPAPPPTSQLGSQQNPYSVYQGWQGPGYYNFVAKNYETGYISTVCDLNTVNIQLGGKDLTSPYDQNQIASCHVSTSSGFTVTSQVTQNPLELGNNPKVTINDLLNNPQNSVCEEMAVSNVKNDFECFYDNNGLASTWTFISNDGVNFTFIGTGESVDNKFLQLPRSQTGTNSMAVSDMLGWNHCEYGQTMDKDCLSKNTNLYKGY